jgi:hypothetical protein
MSLRKRAVGNPAVAGVYGRGRPLSVLMSSARSVVTLNCCRSWAQCRPGTLGMTALGLRSIPAEVSGAAISLSRPGALEAELANVDTGRELRRYSVLQLWIVVPLSLIAMTVQGGEPAPDQLRMLDALPRLLPGLSRR